MPKAAEPVDRAMVTAGLADAETPLGLTLLVEVPAVHSLGCFQTRPHRYEAADHRDGVVEEADYGHADHDQRLVPLDGIEAARRRAPASCSAA